MFCDPRWDFFYLKFYMPNQWRGRAVRGGCRVYPLLGGWPTLTRKQGDHSASQNQRVFYSLVAPAVYRNAKAVGSFMIKNRRHALYKVPCVGTLRHVPLHTRDVVPRGGSVEPGKPPNMQHIHALGYKMANPSILHVCRLSPFI